MWLLWSTLSRVLPFQQSGKLTCSWSFEAGGHAGGVLDAAGGVASGWPAGRIAPYSVVLTTPQSQKTTRRFCAPPACAAPATIVSPSGYARTFAVVSRR